jgi:hypothetical protein
VWILRAWRDEVLMKFAAGRLFVQLYYFLSPPFAYIISKNKALRYIVRNCFIVPFVRKLIR